MNKTIIASFAILVLMIGLGSNVILHSAEAKGIPQHWLNSSNITKEKFFLIHKGDLSEKKYPIIIGATQLNN